MVRLQALKSFTLQATLIASHQTSLRISGPVLRFATISRYSYLVNNKWRTSSFSLERSSTGDRRSRRTSSGGKYERNSPLASAAQRNTNRLRRTSSAQKPASDEEKPGDPTPVKDEPSNSTPVKDDPRNPTPVKDDPSNSTGGSRKSGSGGKCT